MEAELKNEEALNKLRSLITEGDVCMFTTVDNDSSIHSRPMAIVEIDNNSNIWFFTNEFSEKIHEVSRDNMVSLIYANRDKNTYLNIRGNCVVIIDKEQSAARWNASLKAWFPDGLADPKLCLLKVMTEQADFWSGNSNHVITRFKKLKALVTKEKYEDGEEGRLTLTDNK